MSCEHGFVGARLRVCFRYLLTGEAFGSDVESIRSHLRSEMCHDRANFPPSDLEDR